MRPNWYFKTMYKQVYWIQVALFTYFYVSQTGQAEEAQNADVVYKGSSANGNLPPLPTAPDLDSILVRYFEF